jgi:hypothetical protein
MRWPWQKRKLKPDGTKRDWPKFTNEERYFALGVMAGDKGLKLAFRRDFLIKWNERNPILNERELGVVINTGEFKIGDGVKRWKELQYHGNLFKGRNE